MYIYLPWTPDDKTKMSASFNSLRSSITYKCTYIYIYIYVCICQAELVLDVKTSLSAKGVQVLMCVGQTVSFAPLVR